MWCVFWTHVPQSLLYENIFKHTYFMALLLLLLLQCLWNIIAAYQIRFWPIFVDYLGVFLFFNLFLKFYTVVNVLFLGVVVLVFVIFIIVKIILHFFPFLILVILLLISLLVLNERGEIILLILLIMQGPAARRYANTLTLPMLILIAVIHTLKTLLVRDLILNLSSVILIF